MRVHAQTIWRRQHPKKAQGRFQTICFFTLKAETREPFPTNHIASEGPSTHLRVKTLLPLLLLTVV